jgi:hypothetical protein
MTLASRAATELLGFSATQQETFVGCTSNVRFIPPTVMLRASGASRNHDQCFEIPSKTRATGSSAGADDDEERVRATVPCPPREAVHRQMRDLSAGNYGRRFCSAHVTLRCAWDTNLLKGTER